MEKIIVDTNALLYSIKSKIDLFEALKNYEIIIPNLVIKETERLSVTAKKKTDRDAAKNVLMVLKTKVFRCPILEGKTDEAIINYALKNKASILTADKDLKNFAKKHGLKIVFLSKKGLIEV